MAPQRTAKLGESELDPPDTAGGARDAAAADPAGGDAGLFAAAGPFEHYPGAVLLAGRGGRVLGATGAAEPLARAIAVGAARDLDDAVAAALDGKAAQINPFFLTTDGSDSDSGRAYDLIALPWLSGDMALVIARDITLERSLRAALIESRQRYKDLVEASSDFAWETDAEGRFTFVSPRGAVGYAAGQLLGQKAEDFVLPDGERQAAPFATRVPLDRAEIWVRTADERQACLAAVATPLTGADGAWCGARGVCRVITHERERAAELARARHREALLGYILRIVRDELDPASMLKAAAGALVPALSVRGVAIFQRQGADRFNRVAQSGRLPTAQKIKPLFARMLAGEEHVIEPIDQGCLQIKVTRYEEQVNGALCLWREGDELGNDEENKILLAEIAAQIGVANEHLARERQQEKQSSTDALTGLLNRRGFVDSLANRFSRAADRDQAAALIAIGVDNIDVVNDLRGAESGDRVLADLAVLLKHQIRTVDLAARFGGDEFALFLSGIDGDSAGRKTASLVAAAESLRRHSASEAQALRLSIGVALYDPATPETVEGLIARADRALYAAKRSGTGGVSFAEPAVPTG
jgi:diguanylate cyclase (GGDEF)-like protein/PAS domain S-box-containing protein